MGTKLKLATGAAIGLAVLGIVKGAKTSPPAPSPTTPSTGPAGACHQELDNFDEKLREQRASKTPPSDKLLEASAAAAGKAFDACKQKIPPSARADGSYRVIWNATAADA